MDENTLKRLLFRYLDDLVKLAKNYPNHARDYFNKAYGAVNFVSGITSDTEVADAWITKYSLIFDAILYGEEEED